MNTTTNRRRRYPARAAAIATIAVVVFGAAACGTEVASDVAPAAPAPAQQAQPSPHPPTSADSAERNGSADGADRHPTYAPNGHEIYIP
jgi:hypothetical protein